MKRALIITSAGCSTRFRLSVGRDVLKVLYYEDSPEDCLLGQQLCLVDKFDFDHIVVVGGYHFAELTNFIQRYFAGMSNIETVYNEKYRDYGTCYSFVLGLRGLRDSNINEVVFMEGDLLFDETSFSKLVASPQDVITTNGQLIRADTSVIFYVTPRGELWYRYDSQHAQLRVDESFTVLGNSGQIWKFCDVPLLHSLAEKPSIFEETNLLIVQAYFNARGLDNVRYIQFDGWCNCNTVDEYRAMRRLRSSQWKK